MCTRSFASFVGLSYAITWLILGAFVLSWYTLMDKTLQWWAVFFLPGAYGPTIAALIVVARTGGPAAVREWFGKLFIWKVPLQWYVFALLTPPALVALAMVASGFYSITDVNVVPGLAIAPIALLFALPFGPLGEELGWRGYALPNLLQRRGLWQSSLILGIIWTFWHLPMFWFPGASIPSFLEPGAFAIGLYTAQVTAEACILTFLFLKTRGSVLLAVIYHATFNTAETILFRMVPEPAAEQELRVYMLSILFSWILAAILLTIASRETRNANESPEDSSASDKRSSQP